MILDASKNAWEGLPWLSSGSDSTLPLQEAWVLSLAGELRSRLLCGVAKKQTNQKKMQGKDEEIQEDVFLLM